jgi:DNA-binding response OmpR family regulator
MKASKTSVFIVEDDKFYAEIIRNTLVNEGYKQIQQFDTGGDFLECDVHQPDIVILDHMLGQMSGIHVLREIRAKNSKAQVIFLSGQEDMEVVVNALKLGAFDYIEKTDPHAMTRLTIMMNRAMNNQEKSVRKQRVKRLKGWFLIS